MNSKIEHQSTIIDYYSDTKKHNNGHSPFNCFDYTSENLLNEHPFLDNNHQSDDNLEKFPVKAGLVFNPFLGRVNIAAGVTAFAIPVGQVPTR